MGQGTRGTETGTAGTLASCLYDTDGAICGAKVRARGYCSKHYKVMLRAKAFDPARPISGGAANVDRNLGHIDRARQALVEYTEEIVHIYMEGARRAAKKGDTRPAEWLLLHTRTLEPVLTGGAASKAGDNGSQGVRVIIGVQLTNGGAAAPNVSTCTPVIQPSDPLTLSPVNPRTADKAGLPDPVSAIPAVLEAQLLP